MKGYEYLRQLEYRIAILRDKLDYLGEESCSAEERELAALAEFPPLNVCCYPAVRKNTASSVKIPGISPKTLRASSSPSPSKPVIQNCYIA